MNIKLISITIALLVPVTTLYAEITELGQCDTPGRANDVFVAGDYAYIADDFEGLTVIDISDPENPEVAGNWDNPDSRAYSVYVVDEIAFISNSVRGIYALDISDLDDINQLGNIQDIGDAYSVLVTGDIACVTSSNRDLSLINISNPQNMNEIGHRSIQGYSRGIYVIENTAFIGQDRQGLYIIDISDPEHPEIIGSVDTPGNARNVHVSGDYACIADEGGGLRIIDISNPENPDEVGSCDFERAYDVFVSDDYAFVTDNNGSAFAVVDISDPEDPEIVESFDIEIGGPTGFEVVDNYAYIAIGSNGLLILDVSDYTFTGPRIELSTDELDFEDVGLNLSRELPIAITNIGNEDLTVSDILIEDDCFSVDFEDELIIEPDEEAEITVTFSPDESGEFEGTMTITSDDEENQEVEVALLGAGVGAVISIHPRALDFGVVGIEHSEERTLTIRNRGLNDLIISAIVNENDVFDTDFEEEISIEPDQREEITVTFTPQIGIDYADTLVISSNDPDNAEVAVPMGGTGVGAIIVVEPDTVQFGEVGLNRIAEAAITIRNIGQLDLNVSDIVVEGGGFSTDFDEEFSIEPEHSRDISVMFTPERSGLCPGILIIASDDRRNDELVVPLFGTGVGPRIAVDQDSLEFGLVSVGRGEIFLVTISAVGLTDLTITDISIDGDYFHTNFDGEEISIQLNHRHQIVVTFEPEDDGLFDGTLTISSDDEDHSQIAVHLNGSAFKGVLSDTPGLARGVFVDGSYAYIADDEAGLRIIGIFNPDAPTDVGGFDTPGMH
ncbi:MAG: choice-of-anchor D domain-containing protein [Candidatus Hatepunaea meridiana]|nr:choice-of-anchor D domain-containing protein [Candidatus Hatepunaea meridiana]